MEKRILNWQICCLVHVHKRLTTPNTDMNKSAAVYTTWWNPTTHTRADTHSGVRIALCVTWGDRCHCVTADPWCTVRQQRPSGPSFTAENTTVHTASVVPTETQANVCVPVCVPISHACLCRHVGVSLYVFTCVCVCVLGHAFCCVLILITKSSCCFTDRFSDWSAEIHHVCSSLTCHCGYLHDYPPSPEFLLCLFVPSLTTGHSGCSHWWPWSSTPATVGLLHKRSVKTECLGG